jgi:hypothetical protein
MKKAMVSLHNGVLILALAAGSVAWGADDAPDADSSPLVKPLAGQPMAINALLGAINGKPLFVEDVIRPIDADLQRIARVAQTVSDFKVQAREAIQKQIKQQVGDILIIKAAEDSLDDEDHGRVEMFMNKTKNDILTRYGGSAAMTDEFYRSRGSSFDKELSDIRRRAMVDLYLRRTLYPHIAITRRMILDYYQANIKKFTSDPKVDLYTITIPFARFLAKNADGKLPDNPTADQLAAARTLAMQRAVALIDEIQKSPPEKFAEFAENNSVDPKQHSGGRWKDTRRGDLLSKQVEDIAFSLPAHHIAPPQVINDDSPSDGAVMIIKVEDSDPGRVVPFVEAQKQIEAEMREKQYAALSRDYYNKLFEQASIEAVESMLDTATDVAVTRYFTR